MMRFIFLALFFALTAFAQTRIKDLPASGTILDTTTFPIDDTTYGVRGMRMSNLVTMVTSIAATNPATPVAGVMYGIQVVDTAAAMTNLNTIYYTNCITMGRNSKGDSGGGRWYFVTNASSSHVNNGTVWRNAANNGNWYWDLGQTENTIPLALFPGVLNSGSTEIDAGFTAAIAFCGAPTYGPISGSTTNRYQIALPPGEFMVNSVTNTKGVNVIGGQFAAVARIGGKTVTTLRHKIGATGPLYSIEGYSATVRGIDFIGSAEANAQGKVAITAVASRTSFSVASQNLPTIANGITSLAFFYASTGEYLGYGIVTNASGTTVTLRDQSDLYATPGGSLTTAMLVSFTRNVTTFWHDSTEIIQPSPAARGWAGVVIGHTTNAVGYTQPQVIEDCIIRNFHTGIMRETSIQSFIRHTKILNCNFAGISTMHLGSGSDANIESCDIQGQYVADNITDNASGYSGQQYRRTAFGIWSGGTYDRYSHMLIEYCVTGVLLSASGVNFSQGVMDTIYFRGFDILGGVGTKVQGYTFEPRAAPATNSALFYIPAIHPNVSLMVNQISCVGSGSVRYPYAFDNPGATDDIAVNGVGDMSGVVAWRNTNNAAGSQPVISQMVNTDVLTEGMVNGVRDYGTYGNGLISGGSLRLRLWNDGQVILGKNVGYGLNIGFDVKTSAIKFGTDDVYAGVFESQRTSNANKAFHLYGSSYMDDNGYNSTNMFTVMDGRGFSSSNVVTLGGGHVGVPAATRVDIAAASSVGNTYAITDKIVTIDSNALYGLKGFGLKMTSTSSTNYTVAATDYGVCYTGTNAATISLIAPGSAPIGQLFSFMNHGTATITFSTNIVTGYGVTVSTLTSGSTIRIWSDGSNYRKEF